MIYGNKFLGLQEEPIQVKELSVEEQLDLYKSILEDYVTLDEICNSEEILEEGANKDYNNLLKEYRKFYKDIMPEYKAAQKAKDKKKFREVCDKILKESREFKKLINKIEPTTADNILSMIGLAIKAALSFVIGVKLGAALMASNAIAAGQAVAAIGGAGAGAEIGTSLVPTDLFEKSKDPKDKAKKFNMYRNRAIYYIDMIINGVQAAKFNVPKTW